MLFLDYFRTTQLRTAHTHKHSCLFKVLPNHAATELAKALEGDGCEIEGVRRLARCSRSRDLDAVSREYVPLLQMHSAYRFQIPIDNPDGPGSVERTQEMALPHEMFSVLHENYPSYFHRVLNTGELRQWWDHFPEERRAQHPFFEPGRADMTIPLRLYGDDIAIAKTVHCLELLWTSATAFRLPADQAYLPISSTRLEGTDRRTLEEVYKVVRWSLQALGRGKWPARDHLGQEWDTSTTAGAHRARLAGTDLAGEWRALIWEICGDWKWLAESIGFKVQKRYYSCKQICHKCGATTAPGPLTYKTLDYADACFADLQMTASFIHTVASELSLLPGFTVQDTALFDWMHTSPLGMEPVAAGSALKELALEGRWGLFRGEWKVRIGVALKRAWEEFRAYCDQFGLQHTQPQFTAATLSVAQGQEYRPELKAKAANQMKVTQWLASITRDDTADAHRRNRSRVLWSLASLNDLFATAPYWLSDGEAARVDAARRTLFGAWRRLYTEAGGDGSMWPILPKHHAAMHVLHDVVLTKRNPGGYWCFSGEHIMGVSRRSLAGQYQDGLDNRILRSSLVRLGLNARHDQLLALALQSSSSASGGRL